MDSGDLAEMGRSMLRPYEVRLRRRERRRACCAKAASSRRTPKKRHPGKSGGAQRPAPRATGGHGRDGFEKTA